MKIKEVEEKVGLPRANIRYYEREGVFTPERNEDNNYREYTQADVECLKKIKVLRMMDVSTVDIKAIALNEITLSEVMEKRLKEVCDEQKQLKEIEKTCERILKNGIDYNSLSEDIINENETELQNHLVEVLAKEKELVYTKKEKIARGALAISFFWLLGRTAQKITFWVTTGAFYKDDNWKRYFEYTGFDRGMFVIFFISFFIVLGLKLLEKSKH